MKLSQLASALKIAVVATVLAAGLQYASAAWTSAPANPPSGNVDAPLHVGYGTNGFQTKQGGLWLVGNQSAANDPLSYGLVVERSPIKAMGGLVVELRTDDSPTETGRMWLRTDL